MKESGDGRPAVGASARMLGVRLEGDIPIGPDAIVEPEPGGLSVAPGSPNNLPPHRRPPRFGGYGQDPVWLIDEADLPATLTYRPDPANPARHGFVEPTETMTLNDFQDALGAARGLWSPA